MPAKLFKRWFLVLGIFTLVLWSGRLALAQAPEKDDKKATWLELPDLLRRGDVQVEAQGLGIAQVKVKVRRLKKQTIQTRIAPGTFFRARGQASQSMMATRADTLPRPASTSRAGESGWTARGC